MNDPKPCPFCGAPAVRLNESTDSYSCANHRCGAYEADIDLETWNLRTSPSDEAIIEMRAALERLQLAIDDLLAHDQMAALYHELLYEVNDKYPNETRHQTALRYIREREASSHSDSESGQGQAVAPFAKEEGPHEHRVNGIAAV